MWKKVLTWGMIAFLIFFVAFKPNSAAGVVQDLGNTAVKILEGVGGFFSGLID